MCYGMSSDTSERRSHSEINTKIRKFTEMGGQSEAGITMYKADFSWLFHGNIWVWLRLGSTDHKAPRRLCDRK